MTTIAYLRVSTEEQNEARQREAISQAVTVVVDDNYLGHLTTTMLAG